MRRALWAVVVAIPIVALLAYGFGRNPNTIASPLIGKEASGFTLRSLDTGEVVSLSSLRGKPVIINFWASWCQDCKVEHGDLQAAWARYRSAGVAFVGITYQDKASDAVSFMRRWGGGWPIVSDPGQHTAIDYGVYGVPETFFVDRQGIIRYKSIGPVVFKDLTNHIQTLLRRAA
jgi:cytochrome c biogenesis protein CcmG/thiol:disulfide interchange protein DsbE